jgi:hypothetical protein
VTRRCEQSVEEGRRVIIGVDNDVCCDVLRLPDLCVFEKAKSEKPRLILDQSALLSFMTLYM